MHIAQPWYTSHNRAALLVFALNCHHHLNRCSQLEWMGNNNNNNKTQDDIYSAVIMTTRSLREFTRFIW